MFRVWAGALSRVGSSETLRTVLLEAAVSPSWRDRLQRGSWPQRANFWRVSNAVITVTCEECLRTAHSVAHSAAFECPLCFSPEISWSACAPDTAQVVRVAAEAYGTLTLETNGSHLVGLVPPGRQPDRNGAWRLSELGYFAFLRPNRVPRVLSLAPAKGAARPINAWRVPALLLLLAVGTTFQAGFGFVEPSAESAARGWIEAAEFSCGVLFILLSHELGHYVAARRCGIRATLPYVIPMPLLFGTMGAFIQMRSPPPDRDAMIKLGAWGPLAGLGATLIVLACALPFSHGAAPQAMYEPCIVFGEPLLMRLMTALCGPRLLPGQELVAHPAVMAGWFGTLITALNLLPGGQLDGGHILRAYICDRVQRRCAKLLSAGLAVLGWRYWPGWYVWAVVVLIFSFTGNPGPTDEATPPSRAAHVCALLSLVALILTFCPWPVTEVTPLH